MRANTFNAPALLRGAYYAVEQAGYLLDDAVALYKDRRYASAVVLAVFCREELGRARIYLEQRNKTLESGKAVDIASLRKLCEKHAEKLARGQGGITISLGPEQSERFAGIFSNPRSEEYQKAKDFTNEIVKVKAKHQPTDAHKKRECALYVDPKESGNWNRPCETGKEECRMFLQEVANDYASRYHRFVTEDDALAGAIAEWKEHPVLRPPIWPD